MTRHRVHLEMEPSGRFAAAVGPFQRLLDRRNVRFGNGDTAADAIGNALHIGTATFESQDAELEALRTSVIRGQDLVVCVRGRVIATMNVDDL